MTDALVSTAILCGTLVALHLLTAAIAAWRCRPPRQGFSLTGLPPVSILRPLCGIDNFAEETLASSFTLDHPDYELIFCVARADDPVIPLAQALMRRYPRVRARLLIGDHRFCTNPKLNNLLKGWEAATHAWIVIADSNVLMPSNYLQRLFGRWRSDTGLVCSPPAGCWPRGFWAEVECAFLNTYQARWQLAADASGNGYAHGKSMLWRRADLETAGGLQVLACELAEDAAATKVVHSLGLNVHLTDAPFAQPLGRRTMADVWRRQSRWAQMRRDSFPWCYAAEILSGPLLPLLLAASIAWQANASIVAVTVALAALWYGAEFALALIAGWPLGWRAPVAALTRDALLPVLWIAGWCHGGYVWRGNAVASRTTSPAPAAAAD